MSEPSTVIRHYNSAQESTLKEENKVIYNMYLYLPLGTNMGPTNTTASPTGWARNVHALFSSRLHSMREFDCEVQQQSSDNTTSIKKWYHSHHYMGQMLRKQTPTVNEKLKLLTGMGIASHTEL